VRALHRDNGMIRLRVTGYLMMASKHIFHAEMVSIT
jgi:hypothetical protein